MTAAAAADQCPPAAPLFPNFGPMMSYMPAAASYMQAGGASTQMTPPLYWNSAAMDMKPPLMPFGAGTSGSMQPLLQDTAGPSEQSGFTTLVNSVRVRKALKNWCYAHKFSPLVERAHPNHRQTRAARSPPTAAPQFPRWTRSCSSSNSSGAAAATRPTPGGRTPSTPSSRRTWARRCAACR